MKTINFLSMMAAVAIIFNSCAKDGATGPQGPQGATGNANVSTSSIAVAPSQWSADAYGGWTTSFTAIGFSNITKAAISIYWSTDNVNFVALPFVGYATGQPDINYALNSSSITVAYDAQTGVPYISQPSTTIYFNVVVVPQAIVLKHPTTNFSNASEVAQLPEVQAALNK